MKFGTVLSSEIVLWDTLKAAKEWANESSDEPKSVVVVLEETEGYIGKVQDTGLIDVENTDGITTSVVGKRVLIMDPVFVSDLEVSLEADSGS